MKENDDDMVATRSQWRSIMGLIDKLKAQKELLKELLDEANRERYRRDDNK